jgi:hypothetical protein
VLGRSGRSTGAGHHLVHTEQDGPDVRLLCLGPSHVMLGGVLENLCQFPRQALDRLQNLPFMSLYVFLTPIVERVLGGVDATFELGVPAQGPFHRMPRHSGVALRMRACVGLNKRQDGLTHEKMRGDSGAGRGRQAAREDRATN